MMVAAPGARVTTNFLVIAVTAVTVLFVVVAVSVGRMEKQNTNAKENNPVDAKRTT